MHINGKGISPKFVKSFEIVTIFYYNKGKTSRKDEYQMWLPKLGENLLQIDDRGEFYIDGVHYRDFRGVSMYRFPPPFPQDDVIYITLAKNKDPGVFDI